MGFALYDFVQSVRRHRKIVADLKAQQSAMFSSLPSLARAELYEMFLDSSRFFPPEPPPPPTVQPPPTLDDLVATAEKSPDRWKDIF